MNNKQKYAAKCSQCGEVIDEKKEETARVYDTDGEFCLYCSKFCAGQSLTASVLNCGGLKNVLTEQIENLTDELKRVKSMLPRPRIGRPPKKKKEE